MGILDIVQRVLLHNQGIFCYSRSVPEIDPLFSGNFSLIWNVVFQQSTKLLFLKTHVTRLTNISDIFLIELSVMYKYFKSSSLETDLFSEHYANLLSNKNKNTKINFTAVVFSI